VGKRINQNVRMIKQPQPEHPERVMVQRILFPAVSDMRKFMKGTYQWVFNKNEMKYFSAGIEKAKWVIDKNDFSLRIKD
jgi:hypothetical protein